MILRTLELTLLAPQNTDFLVHVRLDPIEAAEQILPAGRSIMEYAQHIWNERAQRVMFVQYNHVNTRRQIEQTLDTEQHLEDIIKALERLAEKQVGPERAPESGWFQHEKIWKYTMSAQALGKNKPGITRVEGQVQKSTYPSKRERLERDLFMTQLQEQQIERHKTLARLMDPTDDELITGTGRFKRAFPTL